MRNTITASIVCVLCAAVTLLSGCNTMQGVGSAVAGAGKDVKVVGYEIKKAAS
jgi:predicted small secreted protein